MMLFLNVLSNEMGLVYTPDNIAEAAKITFVNVLIITVLFKTADYIRRKIMVDRPVKKITEATERIMSGDFSVRVKPMHGGGKEGFDKIGEAINAMAEELSGVETLRTDFIATCPTK
jgi:nitrate/nitrite-specific signal transduction histidine kinase